MTLSCEQRHDLTQCYLEVYLWCIGGHLGSLRVVARCKQVIELACKELFSASQIVADSYAQGQIRILQHIGDVGDDVFLLYAYWQHLGHRDRKKWETYRGCYSTVQQKPNRMLPFNHAVTFCPLKAFTLYESQSFHFSIESCQHWLQPLVRCGVHYSHLKTFYVCSWGYNYVLLLKARFRQVSRFVTLHVNKRHSQLCGGSTEVFAFLSEVKRPSTFCPSVTKPATFFFWNLLLGMNSLSDKEQ